RCLPSRRSPDPRTAVRYLRGNTRRGRRSRRASESWLGYLLIRLLNFGWLPVTAVLLPRRMVGDVTSQIGEGRFPNGNPLSGKNGRALINRHLGIGRQCGDIPRLKP